MADRGEVSRGIAAGASIREIVSGRPGSTVSREIARHGGRVVHRAQTPKAAAVMNLRRPEPTKLASAATGA
ncbi:MAG: IS30 family transposase, partial [Pseudonocardiaceae bacterium]